MINFECWKYFSVLTITLTVLWEQMLMCSPVDVIKIWITWQESWLPLSLQIIVEEIAGTQRLGTGTADECLIMLLCLLFGGYNEILEPEFVWWLHSYNLCLPGESYISVSLSHLSICLSFTLKTWLTKASVLNGLQGGGVTNDGVVSIACFYLFPFALMLCGQCPSGLSGDFFFALQAEI